ncbi:hypothetical protein [Microcystis phage Mae-JY09]
MRRWMAAGSVAVALMAGACGGGDDAARTDASGLTADQRLTTAIIDTGGEMAFIKAELLTCADDACLDERLQEMEIVARERIGPLEAAADEAHAECLIDTARQQVAALDEYRTARAELQQDAPVIAADHVNRANELHDTALGEVAACAESIAP